jgi:hypothetical protein
MPIIIHLFSFLNKKNLETTILLQGLITGDERIELPLKVLETGTNRSYSTILADKETGISSMTTTYSSKPF